MVVIGIFDYSLSFLVTFFWLRVERVCLEGFKEVIFGSINLFFRCWGFVGRRRWCS